MLIFFKCFHEQFEMQEEQHNLEIRVVLFPVIIAMFHTSIGRLALRCGNKVGEGLMSFMSLFVGSHPSLLLKLDLKIRFNNVYCITKSKKGHTDFAIHMMQGVGGIIDIHGRYMKCMKTMYRHQLHHTVAQVIHVSDISLIHLCSYGSNGNTSWKLQNHNWIISRKDSGKADSEMLEDKFMESLKYLERTLESFDASYYLTLINTLEIWKLYLMS